jgi:hypothetical protein
MEEPAPENLRRYLGTFVANYDKFEDEPFIVKVKNQQLVLDVPSQMTFELMEPDDEGYWAFAIAPDEIKVKFDRNEKQEVVGLKLHKAGNVYEVPRKGTVRAAELSKQKIADRQAKEQEKSSEKLTAAWVGKLNMGVVKPVMQFRVVTTRSGKTVAYFDSVTEGRTGFEATWSIKNEELTFEVAEIKLKYVGTLNKAGDMAEGTWSQGGRELPLTLKKQLTEYSQTGD